MKTIEEVTKALKGSERAKGYCSNYLMIDDVLVRISNHLPNRCNFQENNNGVENIFLIFCESELTERSVEEYIDVELRDYKVGYLIINEEFDFTLENIKHFISEL